jgi:hypothetical protein
MQFNPEAKRPNFLLPKGTYNASIEGAEEKVSKKGNPMLVVDLRVYNGEHSKLITDYIVTGGEHAMDWKLAHLVSSTGGDPSTGSIDPATLIGCPCVVKVRIQPPKGDFAEDNKIDDYLTVEEDAPAKPIRAATAAVTDDSAPF